MAEDETDEVLAPEIPRPDPDWIDPEEGYAPPVADLLEAIAPAVLLDLTGEIPGPDALPEALDVLRKLFWIPLQGDDLPPALAGAALRFAVRVGVTETVTLLQNLFAVEATGTMNSDTLAAINGFAAGSDIQRAVKAFALACAEFLNPTPPPDQE